MSKWTRTRDWFATSPQRNQTDMDTQLKALQNIDRALLMIHEAIYANIDATHEVAANLSEQNQILKQILVKLNNYQPVGPEGM